MYSGDAGQFSMGQWPAMTIFQILVSTGAVWRSIVGGDGVDDGSDYGGDDDDDDDDHDDDDDDDNDCEGEGGGRGDIAGSRFGCK